ncbi:MAG: PIG-L family deacetylase, partial [Ginsengibacter sp.]
MLSPRTVTFYVVAHADDWQLFMNPETFKDIKATNKVVIIVTTAGDAGMSKVFWKAREEGMKSSIVFCLSPFTSVSFETHTKIIDQFRFNYYSLNNVFFYFLRLPDGGLDGKGFSSNEYQSLSKLKSSSLKQIISLDGSFYFESWEQFCKTLEKIILGECDKDDNIHVKYLNPDKGKNSHDHPDHKATGEAISSFTKFTFHQSLFAGYGNSSTETLPLEDIFWKAAIFAAYEKTV